MIVPAHWSEAKVTGRIDDHAVTVRRHGWSNDSLASALEMAETRARDAFQRMSRGERLDKREPKVPYNGADGVPIREEIVQQSGETVITRNSYGALCLNTPDVLFADIDFAEDLRAPIACLGMLTVCVFATGLTYQQAGGTAALIVAPVALWLGQPLVAWLARLAQRIGGSPEARALGRVSTYVERNPDSSFDVYRTPAGLRVLARHRTFDPAGDEARALFRSFHTDPIYQRMCIKQRCFRARLTPKPWRIGVESHMKPRPGTWPVDPARLPERKRWIEAYERAGRGHGACRFMETMGTGVEDAAVRPVRELHDSLSRAREGLPIA